MISKKYNLIFLGDSPLAIECMKLVIQSNVFCLKVVVSKSKELFSNTKKQIAWISSESRNESKIIDLIENEKIDMLISVQHPWIISNKIIEMVKGLAFNLHNAKIPDYKGHNTISHAILNEEKTYTTTIHWLAPEVDMGAIAFEQTIDLKHNETAFSLYNRIGKHAIINFGLLTEYLSEGKDIPKVDLDGSGTFYSKYGLDELKLIKNTNEIGKKARAFYFPPHSPAYFLIDGQKYDVIPNFD